MPYSPKAASHPYAPEPAPAESEDRTGAEKALDCVSDSSSSSSSSGRSSGSAGRRATPSAASLAPSSRFSSAASSCLSPHDEAAAESTSATGIDKPTSRHKHHSRTHHARRHEASGAAEQLEMASAQGLWASGGSLCSCPQHSGSNNSLDAAHGVSSVPVTNTARAFARGGSYFFTGNTRELSPAGVAVAATYADPNAASTPTRGAHPYNAAPPPTAPSTRQPQSTPTRGRPLNASPLPPLPRTPSNGAANSTHSAAAAAVPMSATAGFLSTPSRFVEATPAATTSAAGAAAAAHPYHVTGSAGWDDRSTPPTSGVALHQRQSSVSSVHSAAGSGQSTPLAPPKPPRHPSEERAGMPAMWVDIPPSPVMPFVPSHLESQRRRTPRKSSAPPSPVTSTLAASTYSASSHTSSPQGTSMPAAAGAQPLCDVAGLAGHREGSEPLCYSCPPPLPERVPLTSPTASVSSASPAASPSPQLFAAERRGDGAAAATTATTHFPNSPSQSEPSRSPNAEPPSPPHDPTVSPTHAAEGLPARASSGAHVIDAAPDTHVALPPPASVGHRGLFQKPSRAAGNSGGSHSGGTEDAAACASAAVRVAPPPPAVQPALPAHHTNTTASERAVQHTTTVTVRTLPSHPLGYTESQETAAAAAAARVSQPTGPEAAALLVVSPVSHETVASPMLAADDGAAPASPVGLDDERVSSVSEGDEDDSPRAGGGGAAEAETLARLMDAVQRAKERVAAAARESE